VISLLKEQCRSSKRECELKTANINFKVHRHNLLRSQGKNDKVFPYLVGGGGKLKRGKIILLQFDEELKKHIQELIKSIFNMRKLEKYRCKLC